MAAMPQGARNFPDAAGIQAMLDGFNDKKARPYTQGE
jgi:hypothetical protein